MYWLDGSDQLPFSLRSEPQGRSKIFWKTLSDLEKELEVQAKIVKSWLKVNDFFEWQVTANSYVDLVQQFLQWRDIRTEDGQTTGRHRVAKAVEQARAEIQPQTFEVARSRILRRASATTSSSTPSTHPPYTTNPKSTTTSRKRPSASPAHCAVSTATAQIGHPALPSRTSRPQRPELVQRRDATMERVFERVERLLEKLKGGEEERKRRRQRLQEECAQRYREAARAVTERGTPPLHLPTHPKDDPERPQRPPQPPARVREEGGTTPPPPAPIRCADLEWSSNRSPHVPQPQRDAVQSIDCTEIDFRESGEGFNTLSPSQPLPPAPERAPSSEGSRGRLRPPMRPYNTTRSSRNGKNRRRRRNKQRGCIPASPPPPPLIPPPRDRIHRRKRRPRRRLQPRHHHLPAPKVYAAPAASLAPPTRLRKRLRRSRRRRKPAPPVLKPPLGILSISVPHTLTTTISEGFEVPTPEI